MNYRSQLYLPILLAIFLFWSCANPEYNSQKSPPIPHFKNGRELVDHLDMLFGQLSSLDSNASNFEEARTQANQQIRRTIEHIGAHQMLLEVHKIYNFSTHVFSFALSDDLKLAVFSWDSRRDVTNAFKNIALYAKHQKVIPTSLYDEPIIYHEVLTINAPGNRSYYLLHGKGKTQEGFDFYRLDALSLTKDGLDEWPAFPNRQSFMISALPAGSDSKLSADFSIEGDGSLILKPEFWDSVMVYRPLELKTSPSGLSFSEGNFTL